MACAELALSLTVCFSSYDWYVGDWSGCSTTCGGGQRTRLVECRASGSIVAVDQALCGGTPPGSSLEVRTSAAVDVRRTHQRNSFSDLQHQRLSCLVYRFLDFVHGNVRRRPAIEVCCVPGRRWLWRNHFGFTVRRDEATDA